MTTYTFTPHPPCNYYHPCGKCPYFEPPCSCTYSREMKKQGKEVIGGVKISEKSSAKKQYNWYEKEQEKDFDKLI